MFELDNIKNEAILRDLLMFRSRQHQKRSNSARLLQFLNSTTSKTNNSARLLQFANLTTSKTDEFCETSFKNGNLSVELTASCQCVLRFSSPPVESTAPAKKKWCQVIRSAAPVTQNHLSKAKDPMLQNAALLKKSAPWPPNISDEHVFCHAKCIFADPLQMSHACHPFWKCYKTLTFCSLLTRCTIPCACRAKPHLNLQKWRENVVLCTFWLRNVLRAATACTFSTSQLPKPLTPGVLHFEMCFAPQRRALFRYLNFQKWSGAGVLCIFWPWNVLRARTACTVSSLIWPDGSAPAALASLLFDPPEPQAIGKTQCFATFLPFRAPASSFFWRFLFSDLLSSTFLFSLTLSISAFHLSMLSEVWLLNFLRSYTYNLQQHIFTVQIFSVSLSLNIYTYI